MGAPGASDVCSVTRIPKVAFFTDSFHDVNGVAHTSRQLEAFARRRGLEILSVHAGPETRHWTAGTCTTLEIRRSERQIPLDEGLAFDPKILSHWKRTVAQLESFSPDVIHITGPGDFGWLGAIYAWRHRVPLVASWHTNLHEYAARRLPIAALRPAAERASWFGLMLFYRTAKLTLAPNEELQHLIERGTSRPCYLMERGIDTETYTPARRIRHDDALMLGYVGRLRPEKNVDLLARVEQALINAGVTNYRFLIVGEGDRREWLGKNLRHALLPGVLKGAALADTYASMDMFLFPSWTDTFGNVVQEALASGVPTIVTSGGGPKFLVRDGETGAIGTSDDHFIARVVELAKNRHQLAAMSGNARQWALGRTWDAVFEHVWQRYGEAAGSMTRWPASSATASSKAK